MPAWIVPVAGKDSVGTLKVLNRNEKFEFKWNNGVQEANMKCEITIFYLQLRDDLKKSKFEIQMTRPPIEGEITAKQMKSDVKVTKVPRAKRLPKAKATANLASKDPKWSELAHMFK